MADSPSSPTSAAAHRTSGVLVLDWGESLQLELEVTGADALLPKSLAPQALVERVIELADAPTGRPIQEAV